MDTNTAAGAKEAGNAAYKAGRYEVAVALYSKAIELCDDESQRKVCVRVRACLPWNRWCELHRASCMNVCMSGAYISAAQGFMDACMHVGIYAQDFRTPHACMHVCMHVHACLCVCTYAARGRERARTHENSCVLLEQPNSQPNS